jgi:hypothetical protein
MQHNTSLWLSGLAKHTQANLEAANQWLLLPDEILEKRPSPSQWNALECIEHLNRYGDFYLPEFARKIEATTFRTPAPWFKSGWLGNYFTKSMEPKPGFKKMKTLKLMNPSGTRVSRNVLNTFISQQRAFLEILEQAKKVDIGRTRTAISISSLLSLKLGDGLAFFTVHNTRHIEQAKRALVLSAIWEKRAKAV